MLSCQRDHYQRGSGNDLLDNRKDKGKERDDGAAADAQSVPSDDPNPLTELDSAGNRNIWTKLLCRQGKNSASVKIAPTIKRPKVVEVYAARGFQVSFTSILYRLSFLLETKLTETGRNEAEMQDKVARSNM